MNNIFLNLNFFKKRNSIKKIINHNNKYFNVKKNIKQNNIFLIEFHGWQCIHLIYSYVASIFFKLLSEKPVPLSVNMNSI